MADPTAAHVSQILEVLADLSPSAEPQNGGLAVPTAWFRWLPMGAARLFGPWLQPDEGGPASPPSPWLSPNAPEARYVTIERDLGERLAAIDQVRAERLLRVGWLFVVGPVVRPDGRSSHLFHPLVTVPVRVGRRTSFGGAHLVPAGDVAIAGDPQQLRQVSFVSDAQLESVVAARGLDQFPVLAARLDVRRNSAFDLAAGATTVNVLGEHFRSDPHLAEFVAHRLYGGAMQIATRSPATQSRGCVEVVRVVGERDGDGVVAAEEQRVVEELHRALRAGRGSVGVVTPFRAQADAIEGAVLDAFSADELESLNLRVGTAHAFQGNERDLVIVSLGVGPDANAATWRFVEDPHLFAVLMTRARRNLVVLVSADPPHGGLVAGFLEQAGTPPGPPKATGPFGPWAHSIADDLRAAGFVAYEGYPTGRHVLDLCCGWNLRDIDIECQVHPDGPDAHIDRHLELSRRGWQFVDAYASRWRDRRAELVVEIIGFLHTGSWQAPATT